jgi:hypothetical protein
MAVCKAWLHGGPFDGTVLETGWALVKEVLLWHNEKLHRYAHDGPPDEPDRMGPEYGVDLYHPDYHPERGSL